MFGRMTTETILAVGPGCDPEAAVHSLVDAAEEVKVAKWIEFPDSLLVSATVPGDTNSGAVYMLDRKLGLWLDFEDNSALALHRRL